MRNKEVIQNKLEVLEKELKQIQYYINTNDRNEASFRLSRLMEFVGDIKTLINTERQD